VLFPVSFWQETCWAIHPNKIATMSAADKPIFVAEWRYWCEQNRSPATSTSINIMVMHMLMKQGKDAGWAPRHESTVAVMKARQLTRNEIGDVVF
jgi:hypothetical protein